MRSSTKINKRRQLCTVKQNRILGQILRTGGCKRWITDVYRRVWPQQEGKAERPLLHTVQVDQSVPEAALQGPADGRIGGPARLLVHPGPLCFPECFQGEGAGFLMILSSFFLFLSVMLPLQLGAPCRMADATSLGVRRPLLRTAACFGPSCTVRGWWWSRPGCC